MSDARVRPVSAEHFAVRRGFKTAEAAWLLGLPYNKTLELIHAGELGARRFGKYLIVPKAEIDRVLADSRNAGAA